VPATPPPEDPRLWPPKPDLVHTFLPAATQICRSVACVNSETRIVSQVRSDAPEVPAAASAETSQAGPWPSTSAEKARGIPDRVIHYQFRHDRARRTLRGIDEQITQAQRAVDGHAPVKRNRYIQLTGATKSVNRTLEAKTRAIAGWKGDTTNLTTESAQFVIDAYHQLWHIEKAFRMSKHDLQARPIYHHLRKSIEAHLSIVVAAMAVSHYIEHQTRWSIEKFVRTTRRYRTVKTRAGRPHRRRPTTRRPPRRDRQNQRTT
jgi:hypothetical protein